MGEVQDFMLLINSKRISQVEKDRAIIMSGQLSLSWKKKTPLNLLWNSLVLPKVKFFTW